MLNRLIQWSLANRPIVIGVALILLTLGVTTALRLPVEVLPDLTKPTVVILTEAPGLAPEEVEIRVTQPLESALRGVAGLTRLRSNSDVSLSLVYAEFDWGSDIYKNRILVQERVADRFVEKVLAKAKAIKCGDPMDANTDLGTVVHELAAKTFEDRVHKAAEQGAKILYNPGRQGALLPPITVDFVPHQSELVFEETFGPIVPIVRVSNDDDEVIRISNSTPFGLSSGVCTNNLSRITKFIEGLNVGTVNIWEVPGYRIEMSPFGGIKDSGNGVKEGVMEAMKFFTNVKTWSLPWPQ